MNTLFIILFKKGFSRLFTGGTRRFSGQLLHALRAFLQRLRLLFIHLCGAGQSCQPAYQHSVSYHEGHPTRLNSLVPMPYSSVVTRAKPQDVMTSHETKLHLSTKESVYAPRDILALNMPSLRPTFDQPSGLVGVSACRNVISSPDGRLHISSMSAECVQEKRYDPVNRDPM
jgi:hypothetical protein